MHKRYFPYPTWKTVKPHILPERQWNPISYLKDNGTPYPTWKTMKPHILLERQRNPTYYLKDNETPYPTWKTMKSQIHLTVRLHMRMLGGVTVTFASPAKSSMAASAVLRSFFHDIIRRLHTNDVAWPNRPCAVSVDKVTDENKLMPAKPWCHLHSTRSLGWGRERKPHCQKTRKSLGGKCSLHLNKITPQTSISRIQWSSFLQYYCDSKYNTLVVNTPLPLITFPHHHTSPSLSPSLQQVCGHRYGVRLWCASGHWHWH